MLVPLKWLNSYVKINDINPEVFADEMTMSGSKVEEVIETGKEITNVVTAKVLKVDRHPDADKLVVCQLNAGGESIQIVTGADNMKEGDIVPVALHGSTLPGGVKIKKGKLRGVESNGMMCSATELGLEIKDAVHGIHILPENTPLGVDIKEILGLNSVIIDFEITSNRPDCLSIIGMAREASATFNRELKIPEIKVTENSGDINKYIEIEVADKDLCPRYVARLVKNVKIKESPEWLKERLIEAGVRPISNIVDITNYVMLEYGQPLHAFDYDTIEGKKIIVRRAKKGEKITTLDGKEKTLDDSMLLITDAKKALGVAGVMGGENSEVKDSTTSILFEAANFNGTSIRLTAKTLGFRTEASSRFEKGIDPNVAISAVNRAVELVAELDAGEVVGGAIDKYDNKLEPWTIDISIERINKFLGTDISGDDMIKILHSLDIEVIPGDVLKAKIPTFRSDLELEVDIAEEIARIYGYDNIKTTLIRGETTQGGKNEEQKIEDRTKTVLAAAGLYEAITYSFVSETNFDKVNIPEDSSLRNVVRILNPLGEEMSIMRTTVIPSMMEVISRNYSRKIENGQFFEIGRVYLPLEDKTAKLPNEKKMLCMGMYGSVDFYDIKGVIELLFKELGISKYDFVRESENPTFHSGKTAKILIKNKEVGVVGEIHPDIQERYDIPVSVYICELDYDMILANCELERKFKSLPKYPAVERDMALLIPDEVMVGQIEEIVKAKGGELVESIKLFDVYKGKQIPENKKSVAYSITYRSENKTLTDDEVNKVHDQIIKTIEQKLGGQLRM
ncbi:phenylalanine--tRNA ligase beta subunit [Oxobacter pfennigii]|uniref:Phenylalanine--tRNA ligase beta subunit n=1 Tax=Oxobacter pfennigii TaxID=36849 RepID=A0A0P8WJ48_9CLOT|nr:phenylalanine--tRNA ligase subunit beta [Oxobacter pfennigii]KPU42119.1 phenylalanine--tRNA ligase beta subunit [Oxobacter pfennigii]